MNQFYLLVVKFIFYFSQVNIFKEKKVKNHEFIPSKNFIPIESKRIDFRKGEKKRFRLFFSSCEKTNCYKCVCAKINTTKNGLNDIERAHLMSTLPLYSILYWLDLVNFLCCVFIFAVKKYTREPVIIYTQTANAQKNEKNM